MTGVDIPGTYSMTLAGNWSVAGGSELTLTGGNGSVLVPEPASVGMLVMGGGILGAFGFMRRRKLRLA